MRAQLLGDLEGQISVEAALDVDERELVQLGLRVLGELLFLDSDVGLLGVPLGAHRHVLAGGHGHCAGNEPRDARHHVRRRAGLVSRGRHLARPL